MNDWAVSEVSAGIRQGAIRLRNGHQAPVDLQALVNWLGLSLRIEPRKEATRAPAATLVPNAFGADILLRRDSRLTEAGRRRERFSIAHEIGHYCVLRRFDIRPRSKREYWDLEGVCDDFAGRLLIADEDIEAAGIVDGSSPSDVLEGVLRLSDTCTTNPPVAARRVVESLPNTAFYSVTMPSDDQADFLAVVDWSWENRPWLKYGRRKQIRARSPLAQALEAVAPDNEGDVVTFFEEKAQLCARRIGQRVLISAFILTPPDADHIAESDTIAEQLLLWEWGSLNTV